ncbi:MAG: L,D-transpeptidase family protein [Bacillota bacterium]|nr:L,D-transpeptidase family protein [Bacillota bacterium]
MKTGISKKMIIVFLALLVALGAGALLLSRADRAASDSVKIIGFYEDNGSIYYYDTDGKMCTGWQEINGETFYFDKNSGVMVTGNQTIDGEKYTFGHNGKLKQDTDLAKMDAKADGIASDTDYLLLVNCSTHKVGVYQGSKGNWNRLHYWDMSDGRPGHETPRAVYRMGTERTNAYHFKHFDSEGGRLWYATKIWDVYLFHSVPYEIASEPLEVQDPTLGKSVSKGCIRLSIDNAKWIYENIPQKTYCEIYDQ